MIKEISISGFRGFGISQTVQFAMPDNENLGSGLTIITGANNSGKTTIIEAIRAFNSSDSPSFSEGRRNAQTNGKVYLTMIDEFGKEYSIKSIEGEGSSTEKSEKTNFHHYILQSRRAVPFEFGKTQWDKNQYISASQKLDTQRTSSLDNFSARIFQIEKNKSEFNSLISKILGNDFQWTVELRDSGNYYIKYTKDGVMHSSEGVGDGIWSVFTICAALFDAPEKSVIVIDEPELSIHPALQKLLMQIFVDYSKDRQIIISTHSPYFINWEAITNGAQLVRVVKEGINSKCYHISDNCRSMFSGIIKDLNNPHTLGIDANEVFFLEDKIILVEGQEDVVIFRKIAKELKMNISGNFFGWGVGGAPKMKAFLTLFKDMGYKYVVAILDGDKEDTADDLEKEFAEVSYKFFVLPTDDIRDKKERKIQAKAGIATDKGELKEEYRTSVIKLFDDINTVLL